MLGPGNDRPGRSPRAKEVGDDQNPAGKRGCGLGAWLGRLGYGRDGLGRGVDDRAAALGELGAIDRFDDVSAVDARER